MKDNRIAQFAFEWPSGKVQITYNTASLEWTFRESRILTDEEIKAEREKHGPDYTWGVHWRVPFDKREKVVADHETGHYIDNIFALKAEEVIKEENLLKESNKKREEYKRQLDDLWKDKARRTEYYKLHSEAKRYEADFIYRANTWLNQTLARNSPSAKIFEEMKKRGITDEQIKKEISGYSLENHKELFAEGYAYVKNIPKEKYTPAMKVFAEEFNNYFGGKV